MYWTKVPSIQGIFLAPALRLGLSKTQHSRALAQVYELIRSKKFPNEIQRVALRKLRMIDHFQNITDLKVPPGNRLEELKGNRKGQYSIRRNEQWRICFKWHENNAHEVEIVDYH